MRSCLNVYTFSTVLLLLSALPTQACEICGCGAGSYYFGILPQFHRHFLSLRYRQVAFHSHISSDYLRTKETFHITELWGRWYVHPRVQVMMFLPYGWHERLEVRTNEHHRLNGMGDAILMGMYRLWDSAQDSTVRSWKHALYLGGGIKLPTGFYEASGDRYTDPAANPGFQIGTGSWDALLTALYTFRLSRWGISTQWSYKYNTANQSNYQFGHRLTQNTELFYIWQFRRFGIMPHAGIYSEWIQADLENQQVIPNTGGQLHTSTAGIDVFFRQKWQLGFVIQRPIQQNLSAGEVLAGPRYQLQVGLLLGGKGKKNN